MTYLTFLAVGVILIASIISVLQMFVGRFKPLSALVQGTGGVIVIWSIALWAMGGFPSFGPTLLTFVVGIALSKGPRIYKNYRLLANKDCRLRSGRQVRVKS